MSEKPPLSKNFLETFPIVLRTKGSQQQILSIFVMLITDYPDQFEEFIKNFGYKKYNEIIPKC